MEEKNITYRTRVHYIVPSQELIQIYLSEFKTMTFELYVTEEWLQKKQSEVKV